VTSSPTSAPEPSRSEAPSPAFAHGSEAEFARILDFYDVRWEYEPTVFPIRWSLDGTVLESFTPDFRLPDLDLYVELTTLRQKLVRKKNRKLRRLRELYPDVRIKLFYARDFRMLMLKYGKLAIADALTGTIGQVGHEPPAAAAEGGGADAGADDAQRSGPVAEGPTPRSRGGRETPVR
jgi:hypoxanthine phosphoribosyltransferase